MSLLTIVSFFRGLGCMCPTDPRYNLSVVWNDEYCLFIKKKESWNDINVCLFYGKEGKSTVRHLVVSDCQLLRGGQARSVKVPKLYRPGNTTAESSFQGVVELLTATRSLVIIYTYS